MGQSHRLHCEKGPAEEVQPATGAADTVLLCHHWICPLHVNNCLVQLSYQIWPQKTTPPSLPFTTFEIVILYLRWTEIFQHCDSCMFLRFPKQVWGVSTQLRYLTTECKAIVRTAERIIGTTLPTLQELYSSRVSKRAVKITLEPFTSLFELLPSGRRYRAQLFLLSLFFVLSLSRYCTAVASVTKTNLLHV